MVTIDLSQERKQLDTGKMSVSAYKDVVKKKLEGTNLNIDTYILDWLNESCDALTMSAQMDLLEGIMEEIYDWAVSEGVTILEYEVEA